MSVVGDSYCICGITEPVCRCLMKTTLSLAVEGELFGLQPK